MFAPRRVAMVLPAKERFGPRGAGGVALVVRDLARAPAPGWEAMVLGSPLQDAPFEGCRFEGLSPGPLAFLGRNRAHARAAARRLRTHPADVVEAHNRAPLALHLAQALSCPVVLVLHNAASGMGGLRRAEERAALLRQVRAVACVSDFLRRDFLEGLPAALAPRVHVMPNPHNPAAFPADPGPREALILFVGRLNAEKGADSFVAACARALPRLPGWRAEMVGDAWFGGRADTPFVTTLRGQAEAAGVEMLGYLDHAATLARMARASIIVMPNRWAEPFGRVAQEALGAGAALVASRRGGLPEAAGEAALYADPDEPAAIAEAIHHLATHPEERACRVEMGRAHLEGFLLPAIARRWAALREGLLAG
ncbi:glycosyltransferase family 4 protein [Roseococcus suduntuyensis]|uniref:Glycosyltransferase involved in cell wall biosynthesis n=1 Tax=Roseococcus suduntuyensis TaxID=455361 RepID=A0A840AD21_9PROT|nr:glycosyltransferase family 4 protein [Roseococcus suduntuyensis]MBB3898240.1 glycosyltransferase involved in cell wall biosynthesis [Roseococcus suduntuyensis]